MPRPGVLHRGRRGLSCGSLLSPGIPQPCPLCLWNLCWHWGFVCVLDLSPGLLLPGQLHRLLTLTLPCGWVSTILTHHEPSVISLSKIFLIQVLVQKEFWKCTLYKKKMFTCNEYSALNNKNRDDKFVISNFEFPLFLTFRSLLSKWNNLWHREQVPPWNLQPYNQGHPGLRLPGVSPREVLCRLC